MKSISILLFACLVLLACASKDEASCEEIFSRCVRICEEMTSPVFNRPSHLPPPINKARKSCRMECDDELQSCRAAPGKKG
jgi:hypothetical protein